MQFLAIVLLIASLVFGAESISYPYHLTLKENVFDVHWDVNKAEERFYFKVVANTTGWVALALTSNKGAEDMKDYDIALGGVRNTNETYLKDYWSTSETQPTLDTKQNLNITRALEADGKTTIEFSRKADTGDKEQDTSLTMGKAIFLAWAIGKEDATNANTYSKHPDKAGGGRGHTTVGYDMYTAKAMNVNAATKHTGSIFVSIVALILTQLAM